MHYLNRITWKRITAILLLLGALGASAQNGQPQFIKDAMKGCLVWDEYYGPQDKVTWTGGCKNKYAEGQGTLTWYEGEQLTATYEGALRQGKPAGQGRYDIRNYARMEGTFYNGQLNGKGKMVFENGGRLEGNFVNGMFLDLDTFFLNRLSKHVLPFRDTAGIYSTGGGGLHYYALPPRDRIRATLVLLPSTRENTENVISANKTLIQEAFGKGILMVVVSANSNKGLEHDTFAFNFLNRVFADVMAIYKAPPGTFILSGLSLGGENALQYTEMSRNPACSTLIRPMAVIGVDPPVDMEDLYLRAREEIAAYAKDSNNLTAGKQLAWNEDHFLVDYFHQLYGGPPEQFRDRYIAGSQFSRGQADGGNARYLLDVPVRLYCDPDILWQLKNRNRDYYHMNAASLSAMINFLTINGNKQAELIPALGKGYRVDGTRHPHSWSIVDAGDCLNWIAGLIKE
ncbi:hypothetical protein [Taibaiella chishuiensis]|uniref:MORN repeat protein n=1 Tax=Taibaiella chishuiensis TaxID=1434707 RepID=A0A2P8D812_9BACT|nr:hypothetical protein [Taibaiella chishuiensis]PSK93364.1 MORN repeat protein [Taibaiella chishuiensis]